MCFLALKITEIANQRKAGLKTGVMIIDMKHKRWLITLFAFLVLLGGHLIGQHAGYCDHLDKNPEEIGQFIGMGQQVDLEAIDQLPLKTPPNFWRYVPFLLTDLASAVYPNLYFPTDIYADITGPNPDPANLAVLMHEYVHLERMQDQPLWWNLKYLTSKKFRIQEELIAIATEMQYRVDQGLDYDVDRKAGHFSSRVYAWACTYDDAQTMIQSLWNQVRD